MCNHFHLLLEVPPMAEAGLSEGELLKRLSAICSEAFVARVAKELADARMVVYANKTGLEEAIAAIQKRFTYRMQDLGEFRRACCSVSPNGSTGRIPGPGDCGR
jgi:hypothetical protein